jgi:hypothetical protein
MEVATFHLTDMVEEVTFVLKEIKIKYLNLILEHNIINMSAKGEKKHLGLSYLHAEGKNMYSRAWFHLSSEIVVFVPGEYFTFLGQRTRLDITLTQKEVSSHVTAACPFGIYLLVCTEHRIFSMITGFKHVTYLTGSDL